MISFKEELQTMSENFNSPKLDAIKVALRKAASNGRKTESFSSNMYDKWVINWLKAQEFEVEQDQRDGDFLTVSW